MAVNCILLVVPLALIGCTPSLAPDQPSERPPASPQQTTTELPKLPEALKAEADAAPNVAEAIRILSGGDERAKRDLTDLVRAIIEKDPNDPRARDLIYALEPILQVKYGEHDDARGYFDAGLLLEKSRRVEHAIYPYQRAIKMDPGFPEAYAGLGRCYIAEGKYKEAVDAMKHAVDIAPDRPGFVLEYGNALYDNRQMDAARKQYERARELKPDWPAPTEKIARILWRNGDNEKAWEALQTALRMGGETDYFFYDLLKTQLHLDEAEFASKGWVVLNPPPGFFDPNAPTSSSPSDGPVTGGTASPPAGTPPR